MNTLYQNPNQYARMAGCFYLLIIIFGALGQVVLRGSLIDFSNAAVTYTNIESAGFQWRLSIIGDLLMHALDVPLMVILYFLLRPISKIMAMTAVAFNLVQTSVLVVNKLFLLSPLIVMGRATTFSFDNASDLHSLVLLLIDIHDYGFGVGLIFFGIACFCYGVLVYRSKYIPKWAGVGLVLAGTSYLVNSLTLILLPQYSGVVFPILIISLLGELTFALCLVIKGVDLQEWKAVTA